MEEFRKALKEGDIEKIKHCIGNGFQKGHERKIE